MHLVVLSTLPYYKIVTKRIEELNSPSSCLHVTLYDYNGVDSKIKSRPFFSAQYQVFVEYARDEEYLRHVFEWATVEWVRLIVLCPFKVAYDDIQVRFRKHNLKFDRFNSYLTEFSQKAHYIQDEFKELTLGEQELPYKYASYIASRLRGSESQLDFVLGQVSNLDKITYHTVGPLLPKQRTMGVGNFMMKVLLPDPIEVAEVIDICSRYRYYCTPLYRAVDEFVEMWLKMFDEFITGRLSELNEVAWVAEVGVGKEFKITTPMQAHKWIVLLESYSYDLMMFLKLDLIDMKRDTYFNRYVRLLQWVKTFLLIRHVCEWDEYLQICRDNQRQLELSLAREESRIRMQARFAEFKKRKQVEQEFIDTPAVNVDVFVNE